MSEPGQDQDLLWVRYVDWCSARVAERFVDLSPDEVWSRSAAQSGSPPADVSVLELARALAVQLYDELELPTFGTWVESYQDAPERFDRDIVGYSAGSARREETPL